MALFDKTNLKKRLIASALIFAGLSLYYTISFAPFLFHPICKEGGMIFVFPMMLGMPWSVIAGQLAERFFSDGTSCATMGEKLGFFIPSYINFFLLSAIVGISIADLLNRRKKPE